MRIERTVNFSAKLHNLMQYASLNNTGSTTLLGGSLPNINSYMIQGMLSGGLSEQTIIDELLSYIGIDPENESLSKVVSNALGKIIKSVERDLEEKPDENTADDNQNTALTESPIDEFEFDWNIEDTGELFSEDISKENFIENFDALNSSINENDYFSNYLSAINEIGADNFFSVLDSDNDGKLSAEELSALTNADENDKTISAEEFNNIYNKYLGNTNPQSTEQASETTQVQTTEAGESNNIKSNQKSSSGSNYYDAGQNNNNVQQQETEPKETVEDLVKQKQDIITETDNKISALNTQIDTLINGSTVKQELKDNYTTAKQECDNNEKSIAEYETKIQGFDVDLHNIERSIAALKGEKTTLDTNTSDSELNTKNTYRKQAIETKIRELTTEQQTIESNKLAAQAEQDNLKANSDTLKTNFETAQAALENELPETIKNQINELKAQIETAKTEKDTKIAEIDAKIEALKTQEILESTESGEAAGKLKSNPIGSLFVEEALKYNGTKGGALFSTGDYGWCADFVTYVVRQVAMQKSMTKDQARELARDHLGASPQKLVEKNNETDAEGNKLHIVEVSENSTSELRNQVQPGMAFICKGGGASGQHTGFVAEIYDDGTFLSIEGNHGNKVCQVRRNLSEMYRFVDFSYLLV